MLQQEGADLDECTLLLPREHSRVLHLKAELAAREAEKVSRKTKRQTQARATLRRKQARANMSEQRHDGVTKSGVASTTGSRLPQPEPEPEIGSTPLATASPTGIEKLMRQGRHADAMKAMQSLIKGRGSLNMARAVARAAAGDDEGHDGGGDNARGGMGRRDIPSWLKPAPKDWREVRREELKRRQLQQATRGGISWKKLVDTRGSDVPYTATAQVHYEGEEAGRSTMDAEEQQGDVRGSGLGMTQDLADAAGGLPPDVLKHLSAVW